MPIGWYLAQGLYPLSPSSSDDEEGPCTLPNGQIVCGPHGRVFCPKCGTCYPTVDESSGDDEDEDEDEDDQDDDGSIEDLAVKTSVGGREMRRGSGRVFPTQFTPPTNPHTPTELFPGKAAHAGRPAR